LFKVENVTVIGTTRLLNLEARKKETVNMNYYVPCYQAIFPGVVLTKAPGGIPDGPNRTDGPKTAG
jgi:hypothetical protein